MREELGDTFRSPLLYLSAAMMLFGFLGFSLPVWLSSANAPLELRSTALQQSIGAIFFGAMMLFMPLCSTLPRAVSQVEDVRGSMLRWRVLRGGRARYAFIKCSCAALAAVCVTAGVFALHSLAWNAIAMKHDPALFPMHNNFFADISLYYGWFYIKHGLPIYLSMAAGMAISAAVWAIVGLATAVWVPDKLLAVSVPYCLYSLLGTQLSYYLFGVRIPHPSTLFNDALTTKDVWQTLFMYAVLLTAALLVYWTGLNRRVRHG